MGNKRVLVAMSGGVDSSAAALLLRKQGYECDGVMMKLIPSDDSRCCSADDAEVARNVAYGLGMKFYMFNEIDRFRENVMEHFVSEYCAGRTPNPCMDCNRCLKFGSLLDKALVLGYDYLATGHYARVRFDESSGVYQLLRARDSRKDQTYFLYQLTQHQLSHLLLPAGDYEKPEIRVHAREAGLLNADKSDSQDVCFISNGDYVPFLQEFGKVELKPGNFVNKEGKVLGQHKGLPCYTIGQGKGLGISVGKHVYVISKNAEDNTIVLGDNEDLFTKNLTASHVNWISKEMKEPFTCTAKTRYSQREAVAHVEPMEDGFMKVTFDEAQRAITAGQAVVLYDGEVVLGGGVIENTY